MNIEDVKKWRKGYANGVRSEAAINWLISEHDRLTSELTDMTTMYKYKKDEMLHEAEQNALLRAELASVREERDRLRDAYDEQIIQKANVEEWAFRQGAEAMRETAVEEVKKRDTEKDAEAYLCGYVFARSAIEAIRALPLPEKGGKG